MRPNINATATAASFVDTQRRRRGHMFLPPVVVRRDTPELGATEGTPFDGKTLHAHYFVNGWDWYVAEADWTPASASATSPASSPSGGTSTSASWRRSAAGCGSWSATCTTRPACSAPRLTCP